MLYLPVVLRIVQTSSVLSPPSLTALTHANLYVYIYIRVYTAFEEKSCPFGLEVKVVLVLKVFHPRPSHVDVNMIVALCTLSLGFLLFLSIL